jgi:hypothetical protein
MDTATSFSLSRRAEDYAADSAPTRAKQNAAATPKRDRRRTLTKLDKRGRVGKRVARLVTTYPDAALLALAARCEAATKRYYAASDAYAEAEFAVPHNEAEEAETLRLQSIALDELRDLAMPMLWLRASTVDGLLAKARAMKFSIPEDDVIRHRIEEGLKDEGPFEPTPMVMALARDLLALAREAEPTA